MQETDIVIRNINEAFVKVECNDGIAYELRDAFSFFVPGAQFTPKFRSKLWNGKIYLFNVVTRQIYRGLVSHIEKIAKERGYSFFYDSYDTNYSLLDAQNFIKSLNCSHEPRDYQIEFFVHAMRFKRYLMISPTGSGKSLSIYLIIRKILETKKRGLIIVPTTSLVEQLHSDFKDYSKNNEWNVDENVHKIYQGKDKNTNHPLTISTWQSLYKLPRKFFEQFDFVIVDECVHPDTLITTKNGKKKIKDLNVGEFVLTLNETTGKKEYKPIKKIHKNNSIKEQMYEIQTEKEILKITGNHKVMTQRGWIKVDELVEGDDIINTYS